MKALRVQVPVLLLIAALLSAPASSAAAADVFSVRFHGGVALAAWTTCPSWEAGDICEETRVIASDASTAERFPGGRERDRGPRVVLQRFLFEVVDLNGVLQSIPVLESFGGTDDAVVRVDQRSRYASATATVPMSTTQYRDTSVVFEDVVTVHVRWTGHGSLVAIDERDQHVDAVGLSISFTKGWQRPAAVAGTLDGVPVAGVPQAEGNTLFTVRQGELTVYRRQR